MVLKKTQPEPIRTWFKRISNSIIRKLYDIYACLYNNDNNNVRFHAFGGVPLYSIIVSDILDYNDRYWTAPLRSIISGLKSMGMTWNWVKNKQIFVAHVKTFLWYVQWETYKLNLNLHLRTRSRANVMPKTNSSIASYSHSLKGQNRNNRLSLTVDRAMVKWFD